MGKLPSPSGRSTRTPSSLVGRAGRPLLGRPPARGLSRRARSACLIGALAAALLGTAACQDLIIQYVDPPIRLSGDDASTHTGPPTLDLGFRGAAGFVSLAEDDRLIVIHGLQGGTWTMPTVRATGVGTFVTLACTCVTEAGETVGAIAARTRLSPSQDGPFEVPGFPIPIHHAPPHEAAPIDDLYGQRAVLGCSVEDDAGARAEATFDVTLTAG